MSAINKLVEECVKINAHIKLLESARDRAIFIKENIISEFGPKGLTVSDMRQIDVQESKQHRELADVMPELISASRVIRVNEIKIKAARMQKQTIEDMILSLSPLKQQILLLKINHPNKTHRKIAGEVICSVDYVSSVLSGR